MICEGGERDGIETNKQVCNAMCKPRNDMNLREKDDDEDKKRMNRSACRTGKVSIVHANFWFWTLEVVFAR